MPRDERRMELFRDTLQECRLMDIDYSDSLFTWERDNLPDNNNRVHLDRGVANEIR